MTEENAFLYEVVPHHDPRVRTARRPGIGRWRATAYLLLALLLPAGVLLAPLAVTVAISLADPIAHYRVVADAHVQQALRNSLVWLLLAVLVCVLGLALAWVARGAGPVLTGVLRVALVLPAAVSPLTTGAIFRLIFETLPERGLVNALLPGNGVVFLAPGRIWLVVGLAFAWQWSGVAFLVFHHALTRLPADLLRMGRAFGLGRGRLLWSVVVPALARPAALAYLFALVAAARVFDLVLMAAPGAMQAEVESTGLYWWRNHLDLGRGGSAALAVLLSLLVVLLALPALAGLRRNAAWPQASSTAADRARRRRGRWLPGGIIAVLWTLPFAVLVLGSLRGPEHGMLAGWWSPGPWGLDSYGAAFADERFPAALLATTGLATVVVGLVLLAAIPAAYVLAHEHLLPRRTWRPALLVAVALAALPPQAFAVPLQTAISDVAGAAGGMAIVHAALVIPLAVLVLYNAFARVRPPVLARPRREFRHVVREAAPAVAFAAVLAFTLVWNDAAVELMLLPSGDHVTLLLEGQSRHFMTAIGTLAAQATVVAAVPVALVLLIHRWLYRGLIQGVWR